MTLMIGVSDNRRSTVFSKGLNLKIESVHDIYAINSTAAINCYLMKS